MFTGLPAGHRTRRDYVADTHALLRGDVDVIYVKGARGVEAARLLGERAKVVVDIGGNPDTRVLGNNAAPRPLTVDAHTLQHSPELAVRLLQQVVAAGADTQSSLTVGSPAPVAAPRQGLPRGSGRLNP